MKNFFFPAFGAPVNNYLQEKKNNFFFGTSDQQAASLLRPDAALYAIVNTNSET